MPRPLLPIAILLLAWLALAPPPVAPAAQRFAAVDDLLLAEMAKHALPAAAVSIVDGDQVVYLRGYGERAPGGPPVTPQTPFVLASVTKSVTALAVMQLVAADRVALDAPLQRYIPWFTVADPAAAAQITIADLIYQTSGFSTAVGNQALVPPSTPLADYVRALAKVPLAHPVGSRYEYSNTNYRLLGLLVEVVSGEPYPRYVQRHILDPLAMDDAYAIQPGVPLPPPAAAVRTTPAGTTALRTNIPAYQVPSGGLVASAEDLAHYLIALLNGGRYGGAPVLPPGDLARLSLPGATMSPTAGYAMGWIAARADDEPLVWHNGAIQGHRAFAGILPESRRGAIVLLSLDVSEPPPNVNRLGRDVLRLAAGPTAGTEPAFAAVQD